MAFACATAALLAGCVGDEGQSRGDRLGPGSGGGNATAAPPAALPDDSLQLNDCTGATVNYQWPPGSNPGAVPDGWEESTTNSVTVLYVLECHRLHTGPFERPVAIVLETHDGAVAPAACEESAEGEPEVLHYAATTDANVSNHLTEAWNVPVATVVLELTGDDGMTGIELSSDEGVLLAGDVIDHPLPGSDLVLDSTMFSPTQNGTFLQLDLLPELDGTGFFGSRFTGTAASPLLLAEAPQPMNTGALLLDEGRARAKWSFHAGLDCS